MEFGNSNRANINHGNNTEDAVLNNSSARPLRIMERSRITEEDLERLRLNIIESHKRRNSRALIFFLILLFFFLAILVIF